MEIINYHDNSNGENMFAYFKIIIQTDLGIQLT